jgi:hypothetical protein
MWTIENKYTVKFGGNFFTNTDHIVFADGESLFRLKRREDGLLMVDFDVYDSKCAKAAVIRNAHIVDGNREDYEFYKTHHHYRATEKSTGRIVCDIKQASKSGDECELEVSVDLFTKQGFHLIAGPDAINADGIELAGCSFGPVTAAVVIKGGRVQSIGRTGPVA